jgi:hypothetical protein
MHFMPYTQLPQNHKDYHSLWVDFPNSHRPRARRLEASFRLPLFAAEPRHCGR